MMKLQLGKSLTLDADPVKLGFKDFDTLSDVAKHIVLKGAENILKDAHASVKEEAFALPGVGIADAKKHWRNASFKKSMDKYEALCRGELTVRSGGGTRVTNELELTARDIARKILKGQYKAGQEVEYRAALEAKMAEPDVLALAQAQMDMLTKLAGGTLDLAALLPHTVEELAGKPIDAE